MMLVTPINVGESGDNYALAMLKVINIFVFNFMKPEMECRDKVIHPFKDS